MEQKGLVYHYTSIETLYSIMKNKELWLPSFFSTDDKLEDGEIKKVVREVFEEHYKDYPQKIDKKNWLGGEYYVMSFTKNVDSATHFSQYGNNGKGVCIGFDPSCIEEYMNSMALCEWIGSFVELREVIYSSKEIKMMAEEHIKKCLTSPFDQEMIKSLLFSIVISKYESMAKTSNYESEQEVRLLYKPKDANFLIKVCDDEYRSSGKIIFYNISRNIRDALNELHLNEVQYECIGGRVRKLYKMSLLPLMMYNPIKVIILGPYCTQDKKGLIEFARQNGFMISSKDVKQSRIKPRNTK